MSTHATVVAPKTVRPFMTGVVTTMMIGVLAVGIALAMNVARPAQPASVQAPWLQLDQGLSDHRAGEIGSGSSRSINLEPGFVDPGYLDRRYAQIAAGEAILPTWPGSADQVRPAVKHQEGCFSFSAGFPNCTSGTSAATDTRLRRHLPR